MNPSIDELFARSYPIALVTEQRSDGTPQYAVYLFDLPGCIAQGATENEAMSRLDGMKPAYFRKLLEIGAKIPEPTPFPKIVPGTFGFYNPATGAFSTALRSALEGSTQVEDLKLQAVA